MLTQHAQRLYRHVYLACKEENSGQKHYQALFTLLAVLSVELANEEMVVDLIRLVLALQVNSPVVIEMALSSYLRNVSVVKVEYSELQRRKQFK